jgi:glycosyltransferase involved in cell wall biosynthesis
MIGEGVEFAAVKSLALDKYQLTNINFHGNVPYDQLNVAINAFDICLGIFGGTEKANLVIPNKVYHYAGIEKPIISQDSIAMREIFTNEEDMILSSIDPTAIAQNILRLKADKALSEKMAASAYAKISGEYNEVKIAEMFIKALQA